MDDKEVKRKLKDASLYLNDAAKAWPKYPTVAHRRLGAAMRLISETRPEMEWGWDYVNRPLGESEEV